MKTQRILLLRPRPDPETIGLQHVMICEPLELEYLASNLTADGRSFFLADMILEKRGLPELLDLYRPDYVLMTAYITHVRVVQDYARQVKQWRPDCAVYVGGVHAEVVPADFADSHIDGIFRANAVSGMQKILAGTAPAEVAELWGSKLPVCKDREWKLLPPDRSLSAAYRQRYYYMFHNPCALIKTSFGCPYTCTFCFCRQVTDGQYFTRPVAEVIAELQTIPEEEIYIVDDDFLFDAGRVLEFCKALEKAGLHKKFLVYGRSDFVAENEEVIRRFAACGLRAVIIGLESSRPGDLDNYNKRSSLQQNEAAAAIVQRYGVELYGTLILGPDFGRADFSHLYRWLRANHINFINLQPLTPLPGTPLFDQYANRLIIGREEYAKWDLAHLVLKPEQMSIRAYYLQILWLYYRIVARPAHAWSLIRRYGPAQVLKLWFGSARVSWQYIQKALRGNKQ
ncbi:MAG: radical SAM protein [Spirochaetes bacterium]|nr:radical SAM protein [Spirochaetota bacterium]